MFVFNAQKMKTRSMFSWNAETVASNSLHFSQKQVMLLEEEEQEWRSRLKPTIEGHNGHFFKLIILGVGGGVVCVKCLLSKAAPERICRSTTRRRLQTTKKESETTPPKRVLKQPPLVRLNG